VFVPVFVISSRCVSMRALGRTSCVFASSAALNVGPVVAIGSTREVNALQMLTDENLYFHSPLNQNGIES